MSICDRSTAAQPFLLAEPPMPGWVQAAGRALAATREFAAELRILYRFALGLDYLARRKADGEFQ